MSVAGNLRGKRVTVLGLGRSGIAAARLAVREGATVICSDARSDAQLGDSIAALRGLGVTLELGAHRRESFTRADLVVKSPGVSPRLDVLAAAREAGVPVIGEVELCVPFLRLPVVAITGTNGKSTTTALAGHLLRAAGRRPFVGGNLGTPVAEFVLSGEDADALVLELSSYQLDDLLDFRADVACVLNLSPDHLERYGSMDAYAASKRRLVELIRSSGLVVLNAGDSLVSAMADSSAAPVVTFAHGAAQAGQLRADGTTIVRSGVDGDERYQVRSRALRGRHNVENAMAAIAAARALGAAPEAVQSGLDDFPGLPHRIEVVRVLDGVEWVNDSKATNVDSVEKSLAGFAGSVHLILGGRGKGSPYEPLRRLIPGRVARVYVLGEDADRISEALEDIVPVERTDDLETAVRLARGFSRPGETVLLSPACASFDQFRSFEHRGEVFRQLVLGLGEGH